MSVKKKVTVPDGSERIGTPGCLVEPTSISQALACVRRALPQFDRSARRWVTRLDSSYSVSRKLQARNYWQVESS